MKFLTRLALVALSIGIVAPAMGANLNNDDVLIEDDSRAVGTGSSVSQGDASEKIEIDNSKEKDSKTPFSSLGNKIKGTCAKHPTAVKAVAAAAVVAAVATTATAAYLIWRYVDRKLAEKKAQMPSVDEFADDDEASLTEEDSE